MKFSSKDEGKSNDAADKGNKMGDMNNDVGASGGIRDSNGFVDTLPLSEEVGASMSDRAIGESLPDPEAIVSTASHDEFLREDDKAAADAAAPTGFVGRIKSLLSRKNKKAKADADDEDESGYGNEDGRDDGDDLSEVDRDDIRGNSEVDAEQDNNVFVEEDDPNSIFDLSPEEARMNAILADIGSKPKGLPIIGGLAPRVQYGVGVSIMTVALIGAGVLASFGLIQSSQYQARAEVGTQLKMLSQRLMATTQHSISGSSDAFNKLRESRAAVIVEFDKIFKGTTGLPMVEPTWNEELGRLHETYVRDVLPMVDKVLNMGVNFGDMPASAGVLNEQSAVFNAAAERLLAHLISTGAPQSQITSVYQLIESSERMRRSGVLLLASSDSSSSGDNIVKERLDDQFEDFKKEMGSAWAMVDGALTINGAKIEGNDKVVDIISERYPGVVATVYQVIEGELVRLSTSEKKEDGSRASGSIMGKSHPAYANLLFGNTFNGQVVLFGRPHITKYEPIKNAENKIIGALSIAAEIDSSRGATHVLADYISAFNQLQKSLQDLGEGNESLGTLALSDAVDTQLLDELDEAMLLINEVNLFLQDRAVEIIEARASMSSLLIAAESALLSSDSFSSAMSAKSRQALELLYTALALLLVATAGLALIGAVNNRINRIETWATAFKNKSNERDIIDFMSEILPLEMGDLTVSFTNNTSAMEGITGGIRSSVSEAVSSLRAAMATVMSTTHSVINNVNQSVAGSRDLSESNERQAKEIGDVVSRVTELTGAIDQVTGDTNRATEMTEAAKSASDTGARVVSQTNEKMTEIRASMQDVLKSVKHLGETSHEIGTIVEAIETITDRTQVIAVNASLEAAKAGAAGHGFSVLAGEVNRLAEQSNEALRTITALVQRIQGETAATIRVVEDSTNNVVEGARLSEAANVELTKISGLSEMLQQVMQEIHKQSASQSNNAGSVRESMGRLVSLSRDFQASVAQMVQGVESIDVSMGTLQSTVSIFKTDAEEPARV